MVVGVDRSGTTLLSLMLDSHSRIAIPYESKFFIRYHLEGDRLGDLSREADRQALVERMLAEPSVSRWRPALRPEEVDVSACSSLADCIDALMSAYARAAGKEIWGDKTPAYIQGLHVLNAMFPEARFVHIIRDGRDVALSLMRQWWGPNDFVNALRYWRERVACARKMLRMLPPGRFVELRYEDLIAEPERELRRVTDFLGLEFEPDMLTAYTRTAGEKVGDLIDEIHPGLRRAPDPAAACKWKRSLPPADQAIAHEIAGRLLAELGYPEGVKASRWKPLRELYHRLRAAYAWRFADRTPPPAA